jgi:hypothetical protein
VPVELGRRLECGIHGQFTVPACSGTVRSATVGCGELCRTCSEGDSCVAS